MAGGRRERSRRLDAATSTGDQLAELDAALAHARSVTDDVLDVTADDFPLPTLAPLLHDFAEELVNGRGFGRIGTLDIDRLGAEDASWIYWGIGRHLGEPWPQNAKGHLLGDVTDQGKAPDDPTARGNEIGGHPLGFHSDGSDLVGLLCIDDGVSGGESLVANALYAHNELVRTAPHLAATLYEPLPYDFRGEQREGGAPFYFVPTFTRHGDRLFIRYIRPFIEASQRHEAGAADHRRPARGDGRLRRARSTTPTTGSRWRCGPARCSSSTTTTCSTPAAATPTTAPPAVSAGSSGCGWPPRCSAPTIAPSAISGSAR